MSRPLALAFLLILGVSTRSAVAAEPRDFGQVAIVDAEPPAERLPPKRAVPDYDGRGDDPTTAQDVLLWAPRLLLAPLYLAFEYLLRRPVGAIVIAIERDKLMQRALHVFSGGSKKNLGFVPTFYWESRFYPSAGVYFWWDDVGSKKNHVRAHVATWGVPVLSATVIDRFDLGSRSSTSLRASFLHRDDNMFYGLGPDTKDRNQSRYGITTFEVGPGFDVPLRPGLELSTRAGVRDTTYRESDEDGSLYDTVRRGNLPPPPRLFSGGYTTVFDAASFTLDSRRSVRESGVRTAISGAPSFDVSRRPGASWLRYEANATGFWDVTGTHRVLSLGATAMFVDGSDIPFTEQITLGGTGPMRGFYTGRLVGRSAAVVTLAYDWPIWSFFDGTVQAATGNVFGAGLKDLDLEKLRLSTMFGLRSNTSRDHAFELLTGFGTDTLQEGAGISSFRIALGATRGF